MSLRTKLAFLGGLAGVIGTPLISFTQNLLLNVFAHIIDIPASPFRWDLWISDPWNTLLRWDELMAGFLAVFLIAPVAIRRIDSPKQQNRRFPKTGASYGALAGFICCMFLAFIRLSAGFVGPALYREGFSALPSVLGFFTTYLPIVAIMTGPFAAIIGACVGAIVELRRRKNLQEQAITAEMTD